MIYIYRVKMFTSIVTFYLQTYITNVTDCILFTIIYIFLGVLLTKSYVNPSEPDPK